MAINRNKRSITLDFRQPAGQEVLHALIRQSDVLVENFIPGSLAKYNLDYASIRELHPDIVYCSISGFGSTGPLSGRPGYDLIASAMFGLLSITGPEGGEAVKPGVALTDVITGYVHLYCLGLITAVSTLMEPSSPPSESANRADRDSTLNAV
jgi:succinate--hydroxymethylglutarate CoA-transferase